MRSRAAYAVFAVLFMLLFVIEPVLQPVFAEQPRVFDPFTGEQRLAAAPMLDYDWRLVTRGEHILTEEAVIGGSYHLRQVTVPYWVWDGSAYVPYTYSRDEAKKDYIVRNGLITVEIYDSGVASFYDVNYTQVRVKSEEWQLWYSSGTKQASLSGTITFSVTTNSSGVFIVATRASTKPVGTLTVTYILREGSPLKHQVTWQATTSEVVQVKQVWDMVGVDFTKVQTDQGLVTTAGTYNASLFTFYDSSDKMLVLENQASMQNWLGVNYLKPTSIDFSGKKVAYTFGDWSLASGQSLTIDPDSSTKGTTTWANDGTSPCSTTNAWTNPTNAQSSDNIYATAGTTTNKITNCDKGSSFGFGVSGTVNGVQVGVEKKCSAQTLDYCKDLVVNLVKAGSYVGNNKADTTTHWTTSDTTITYPTSTTDLWGTTWTASEINNAGFGVGFAATIFSDSGLTVTASLDYISITVYYSPDVTITWALSGVGADASGTIITIDSVNYVYANFPKAFTWAVSSTHSVAAVSVNAGGGTVGKRYAWSSWTNGDGLSGASGTYTVPSSGITVTAVYVTQYLVTYTSSGISSDTGSNTVVTVDSVAKTQANLPFSTWYTSGASSQYAFSSPVSATSSPKRYPWSSTSGLSQTLQSNTFTVTVNGTVTGTFTIQYQLGVTLNGFGTSTPASGGWYASAANVQITINSDSSNSSSTRRLYNGATGIGSGSYTGSTNPFTVTMNSAVNESIAWKTQYDLKIQAVDKYSTGTVLSTTKASINITQSGGGTQVLFADGSGNMDFGWYDSGQQVYMTGKYVGTVVNGTWHTSLYTISSSSVFGFVMKFDAYVTLTVSVPSGAATDSTKWNFTSYYVTTNSSATFNSGTAKLYYASVLIKSQNISATSTLVTPSVSLAGSGTATFNVTDGYVWLRTQLSGSYAVTVSGLADTPPSQVSGGTSFDLSNSYTNTAIAKGTYLITSNSWIRVQVLSATGVTVFYTQTYPYYNASANAFKQQINSVAVPSSLSGGFILRLSVMQHLLNGTDLVLAFTDSGLSITGTAPTSGFTGTPQPRTISFFVDKNQFSVSLNQTHTVVVDMPVQITGVIDSLTIRKVSFSSDIPWITVAEPLPKYYNAPSSFTIRITVSPGLDVKVTAYIIQAVFEGTVNGVLLWQPVLFVVYVYPAQAQIVQSPLPIMEIGLATTSVLSLTWGVVRHFRKPT